GMTLRGYVMELGTRTRPAPAIALEAARQIAPAGHRGGAAPFGPVQPVPAGAGVDDQPSLLARPQGGTKGRDLRYLRGDGGRR
ncbi:MAG: hypothetical protein M3Y33_15460, partial [Actinomycetota bacterium]|nr:hypothetical protein [Actinomycetota bacterium]